MMRGNNAGLNENEPMPGSISSKVAEVFMTAGMAFNKLGDLTMQLNSASETQENMRWTEREVDALRGAMERFNNDLENICKNVQIKTVKQIRTDLKRKQIIGSFGGDEGGRESPGGSGRGRPPINAPPRKAPRKSYGPATTPRPTVQLHHQVIPSQQSSTPHGISTCYTDYPDLGPPTF